MECNDTLEQVDILPPLHIDTFVSTISGFPPSQRLLYYLILQEFRNELVLGKFHLFSCIEKILLAITGYN